MSMPNPGPMDDVDLAWELNRRTRALITRSLREAKALNEQALSMARESRDPHAEAEAIRNKATLAVMARELDVAEEAYSDTCRRARSLGLAGLEAAASVGLGLVRRFRSDYAGALVFLTAARAWEAAAGEREAERLALCHLAALHMEMDDPRTALSAALAACDSAEEDGVLDREISCRAQFWAARARLGATDSCRAGLERCLADARRESDGVMKAQLLAEIAAILREQGRFGEARARIDEGLDIADTVGDPASRAVLLLVLGDVLTDEGNTDAALERLAEVREHAIACGHTSLLVRALRGEARADERAGRDALAEGKWREVEAIASDAGLWGKAAEAAAALARIALGRGDIAEADHFAQRRDAALAGLEGENGR
ncbi:MAG: hypothetical protein ACKO5K_12605 [Armatimonadota bacterium]